MQNKTSNLETRSYMNKASKFKKLCVFSSVFLCWVSASLFAEAAATPLPVCPPPAPAGGKRILKSEVYKGMPYGTGEVAHYTAHWSGIHAGDHTMRVLEPVLREGSWHQVFTSEAITGDWFKGIYTARYLTKAYCFPVTFGASWFHGSEYRKPPLFSEFKEEKSFSFLQQVCSVKEEIQTNDKKKEYEEHFLERGATDVLSGFYKLRTATFELHKSIEILAYSSAKNWTLQAEPVLFETLALPIGKIEAVKLKMHTYMGKELQQKGDVYTWIATKHPNHPLLQVEGKVKWGSVRMVLDRYTPGASK